MKRLLITVLAIFYLSVSSGATVHFHYCMGELIEWGLSNDGSDKADNCSNCGMKKGISEDCCKDQKQEYKLKESQKTSLNTIQSKVIDLAPLVYPEFNITFKNTQPDLIPAINAPPRTQKTSTFLRHCNFRI